MVLNISEMEAKVREATNDDPWCAFVLPPPIVFEVQRITDHGFVVIVGVQVPR